MAQRRGSGIARGSGKSRIVIALVVAAIALFSYFASREYNPITGEDQAVAMSREQEIALGLQAAPEMAQQHGGLERNEDVQTYLDEIGAHLVQESAASQTEWPFEFHLLADDETINAFALPGGQIFITNALYQRLETEGQVAGVLGHEMGHVVGRHASEQLAKAQLTQGLAGAAVIVATDPDDPNSQQAAQIALLVNQLLTMRFSREDELESDRLGVRFMAESGYDPRALIVVMEVLAEASAGNAPPEFFSTHPNPDNRIENIQQAIAEQFPDGVPPDLIP